MLTHTEFFYEVWAEKIRSKPVLPYVRVPKNTSFFIPVFVQSIAMFISFCLILKIGVDWLVLRESS